jgi:hypothetical protein
MIRVLCKNWGRLKIHICTYWFYGSDSRLLSRLSENSITWVSALCQKRACPLRVAAWGEKEKGSQAECYWIKKKAPDPISLKIQPIFPKQSGPRLRRGLAKRGQSKHNYRCKIIAIVSKRARAGGRQKCGPTSSSTEGCEGNWIWRRSHRAARASARLKCTWREFSFAEHNRHVRTRTLRAGYMTWAPLQLWQISSAFYGPRRTHARPHSLSQAARRARCQRCQFCRLAFPLANASFAQPICTPDCSYALNARLMFIICFVQNMLWRAAIRLRWHHHYSRRL